MSRLPRSWWPARIRMISRRRHCFFAVLRDAARSPRLFVPVIPWLLIAVLLFFVIRSLGAQAPASQPSTSAVDDKQFKTRDGKTLPSMDDLSKLTGDAKAGAAVFRNVKGANCIKCHEIGTEGNMIGPPLTVIGGKLNKLQLYEAVLYPSAAIEMGYEAWIVKTKKGEVFAGLKVEDTPDRITIKDTDGKYHDVDRDDIARLVKQTISLMPEGLSETMTQPELVDLVEYLATLKS
jgi:putative heme-binding domain-containing protein